VSARHQAKRLDRYFRWSSLWRKPARQKKEVFFIGADPKLRSFTGALRRLGFGPDVFADALVPRRCVVDARALISRILKVDLPEFAAFPRMLRRAPHFGVVCC